MARGVGCAWRRRRRCGRGCAARDATCGAAGGRGPLIVCARVAHAALSFRARTLRDSGPKGSASGAVSGQWGFIRLLYATKLECRAVSRVRRCGPRPSGPRASTVGVARRSGLGLLSLLSVVYGYGSNACRAGGSSRAGHCSPLTRKSEIDGVRLAPRCGARLSLGGRMLDNEVIPSRAMRWPIRLRALHPRRARTAAAPHTHWHCRIYIHVRSTAVPNAAGMPCAK